MIKGKSLCLLGIMAALMLSACGDKAGDSKQFVTHGENVANGNTSLIMDPTEGQKAELTMPPESARVKVTIGVVKNDAAAVTLASLAEKNENDTNFEKYELVYADNYTQLSSMLKDNTLGIAVMPPTKALDMYAADKSVKVLASLTGKSYRLIGENINSLADLEGKTVYMSNDDKTPLCVMTKLISYAGVKDCRFEFAADNKALSDIVKNNNDKDVCAILPQPYLAMLKQDGAVLSEYDFTQDWQNATEGNGYSTGSVVATNEFMTTQKSIVDYVLADIEKSVEAVKNDADSCAQAAVKYDLADDAKAISDAYSAIDCGFFKDKQMRYLINNMFTAFDNADAEVMGTDVPDEEFYLVKQN